MILKMLTHISRVLVGLLFIYSGFVKLVDPIGSQYKFEEYFSAGVLNLEFLIPFALPFSILLIVTELVLGIMLLVGYKPKLTVWSLFGLNLVFLFLTWYSYTYNKVTDCGCFGDALKLTPKETFYKNVVFMIFIVILILGVKHIKPLISNKFSSITTFSSVFLALIISYYVLQHLPIIDFRAYAIGTDIAKGMEYPEDSDELPPIHDFMIETDEGDKLEEMLAKEKAMLIIMSNFKKTEKEGITDVSEVAKQASEQGYEIYVLTASYIEDLAATQKEYGLPYTFGFCDETALKTVIRANPGIVTVKNGVIVGKWNWTDADDVEL
ncbi:MULTISPECIES: BT_3928 family protein [Tenacibaculum]|uniref:DoxX family protein n=1 Tax=Tenacibaculum discolor TaxID=361581 RepID=A0A2G1BXV9_9FLAO|nr:BT_3928 family protein [Tenacibaculum discolor]MDP2541134.1 DoxX family protein [Tenacibaculum discolor]PHN98846.1 DoxX family protein [Tenacibaculum discolor]PHO00786.1 DoxX family protein [Rhodobacteraceae bacterium 4F10]RLJ97722.1 DoxX-like protein [Tenacibaculum discolor]